MSSITIFEMGKVFPRITSYLVFILFLLPWNVVGRHLHYELYDGVSDGVAQEHEPESFLHLKGHDYSEDHCELMYGFLPCSSNVPSHIFLIVIYEYLLYHGESYAGGDGRIFRVLGKNFYVAMFSQLLDSLPESLILLATGLTTSKQKAQDYVVTGAGLLAGSSILLLTLLWGVCFICARTKSVKYQGGVVTDVETKYHAKVMFFSLIPLVVILIPSVFGLGYSSEGYKIVLLVSLCVSLICLFSYFFYQSYDSRIQKRRLEYAEVERKVEMHVPFYEVQALMLDREKHLMIKQKEMEKWLKHPQPTDAKAMTRDKFYDKFEKWIDETRQLMDDPYSMDKSGTEYNQVAELLLEDKNKLMELISHVFGEKMFMENGAIDESSIDRFFECIDDDQNKSITRSELKNYFMEQNSDEILIDEEMAEIIMRHLDIDKNGEIDQEEFKSGITKWLKQIDLVDSHTIEKQSEYNNQEEDSQSHDNNKKIDKFHRGEAKAKAEEKFKAITLLLVGIIMLTILAEPLVESVRKFSESLNIEPFYVSFILVPLATNARTAIAAIRAASQKRHLTTSLTFSEIYHKVFMNNILGLFVLVSVIYFRGLTWHFSAEILVVVIVCIIMGILTSFKSKFPNWTLFIAFPLYPLSLVMVYFVADTFQLT
ncbi:hypothetical protein Lser_V15G45385 [Lactuca serriola]